MPSGPNLRVLGASRKAPSPGDIFVLSPIESVYLFGRVVVADASVGRMPAILIYVYDIVRATPETPDVSVLKPERLLLPPLLTNRLGWSRGFFRRTGHAPLAPDDVLAIHCFRDSRGRHFDEHSRPLAGPVEPVGQWGLHSFRTIDDAIGDVLGLPRASS